MNKNQKTKILQIGFSRKTFGTLGILLVCIVFIFSSSQAFALSAEQKKVFLNGAYYFDVDTATCFSDGGTATVGANSSVYMLGDSITVRAESKYNDAFKDNGVQPYINASVGRSWDGAGSDQKTKDGSFAKGSDAIVADKAAVKAASGIIIALGSNGGLGGNPIDDIISTIRSENSSAPIWWVNITGTNAWKDANLRSYMGKFNKGLNDAASGGAFNIINWATTVAPGSDPYTTPGTASADPDNMLADGLHPNDKGTSALSNLVVSSVMNGVNETGLSTSCCASGDTSLQGNDNQEKAFNYYVEKGLSANAAAAFVGNFIQESNVNPKSTNSIGAHGIAQWLGGRRDNLTRFATKYKVDEDALSTQLDFSWKEVNDKTGVWNSVGKLLEKLHNPSSSLVELTTVIFDYYESPGDDTLPTRIKNARDVLASFGASTITAGGDTITNCSGSGTGSDFGKGKGEFTDNTSVTYPGVNKMLARVRELVDLKGTAFKKYCTDAGKAAGRDRPNCAGWCAHIMSVAWGYATGTYGSYEHSAAGQWLYMKSTGHAHPDNRKPPIGALLFYATGTYGHVAIYLGNNKVFSNDVLDSQNNIEGGVYVADASKIEGAGWGLPYLGWADPYYSGKIGFGSYE